MPAAMLLVLPLYACQAQGPFERAGADVDESVEDVRDVVEDARDDDERGRRASWRGKIPTCRVGCDLAADS
jgi:hypothetical protein